MSEYYPADETEAAGVVRAANASRTPFVIEGGGTRAALGRPVQAASRLSTRNLSGIVFYEPAEMVIRARAGTSMALIEHALAGKGQMLPFEPMDHRALYNSEGDPTIGAVAACNISGPRRVRAGAARDALLGVRVIDGKGDVLQSGGRVMKNVTGLDLVRLHCGAHGTLGLLTEVTFRLLPVPRSSGTLVLEGLDDQQAISVMSAALATPFEVSAAAHLPVSDYNDVARTFLRVEHVESSVAYRLDELEKKFSGRAPMHRLDHAETAERWKRLRDAELFSYEPQRALWRISVAPSKALGVLEKIRAAGMSFAHGFDWGGGLIWLQPAQDRRIANAGSSIVRKAMEGSGGHATLVRAQEAIRAGVEVFQPLSGPLMQITAGIKAAMDPSGIINPGRMYGSV